MDFKKTKGSSQLVDLTGVTGPNHMRQWMLNNFLQALLLNKKSLPNENYYSGLGEIAPGKKYPFRPVEGPQGNVLLNILTNPNLVKDGRYSEPRITSPFYNDYKYNIDPEPERRGSMGKNIKKRY